jgi:hypothetical protein
MRGVRIHSIGQGHLIIYIIQNTLFFVQNQYPNSFLIKK